MLHNNSYTPHFCQNSIQYVAFVQWNTISYIFTGSYFINESIMFMYNAVAFCLLDSISDYYFSPVLGKFFQTFKTT